MRVKGYCVYSMGLVVGMSDGEMDKLVGQYVGSNEGDENVNVNGDGVNDSERDGLMRLIPYIELRVNGDMQREMFDSQHTLQLTEHSQLHHEVNEEQEQLNGMPNCKYITNIAGILLPNINALHGNPDYPPSPTFILTPTVTLNLRLLAQSISLRLPVLLEGSSSSGKTALVSYLATRIANKGLFLHYLFIQKDC